MAPPPPVGERLLPQALKFGAEMVCGTVVFQMRAYYVERAVARPGRLECGCGLSVLAAAGPLVVQPLLSMNKDLPYVLLDLMLLLSHYRDVFG